MSPFDGLLRVLLFIKYDDILSAGGWWTLLSVNKCFHRGAHKAAKNTKIIYLNFNGFPSISTCDRCFDLNGKPCQEDRGRQLNNPLDDSRTLKKRIVKA